MGFIWRHQLYISGRLKDMMVINGKNYYPNDVEAEMDHLFEQHHHHPPPSSSSSGVSGKDGEGSRQLLDKHDENKEEGDDDDDENKDDGDDDEEVMMRSGWLRRGNSVVFDAYHHLHSHTHIHYPPSKTSIPSFSPPK